MAGLEGLSKDELKELILEQLVDAGIDTEAMEVEIGEGPRVILRGKVDFNSERAMIKEIIMDVAGVDDIIDELAVIRGAAGVDEDDSAGEEKTPCENDEEFVGTEDMFQSVEEGVPYIPPTNPTYQESSKNITWKKRKTRIR